MFSNSPGNQEELTGLIKRVRSGGFSYIPVYAACIEIHELSSEREFLLPCLFIPNHISASSESYPDDKKLFNLGVELTKEYNQDYFLYRPMGDDPVAHYIDNTGNAVMTFTNKSVHDLANMYFTDLTEKLYRPEPQRFIFTKHLYLNKSPKDMQEAIARYGEHFYNFNGRV